MPDRDLLDGRVIAGIRTYRTYKSEHNSQYADAARELGTEIDPRRRVATRRYAVNPNPFHIDTAVSLWP